MGKFVYYATVSLDGYMEDPDGGINFSEPDEEVHRHSNRWMEETGLVIMGRRLCEVMEPFWPDTLENPAGIGYVDEFAQIWARKPKLVFSRTMTEAPGDVGLIHELDPAWAEELRDKVDGMISVGGADLASAFAAEGLIDEIQMLTVPKVLGGGKPMLGPGFLGLDLSLIESHPFSAGTITSRYAVTSTKFGS